MQTLFQWLKCVLHEIVFPLGAVVMKIFSRVGRECMSCTSICSHQLDTLQFFRCCLFCPQIMLIENFLSDLLDTFFFPKEVSAVIHTNCHPSAVLLMIKWSWMINSQRSWWLQWVWAQACWQGSKRQSYVWVVTLNSILRPRDSGGLSGRKKCRKK